ncbi:hypothetical protein Syun_026861 [Stephania yunnanensis]|uniref:FAS1 domain-containing protein n=1 Tax=Stephania yunnanensis TaxID=152371 RepID=A0AAP0HQS0_9MAGN
MRTTQMLMFAITLVVLLLSTAIPTCTAKHATPAPTPTPAPSPPPNYVNLTDLLTVAGPFHKFLNLLEQTQVLDAFQNQANNTQQGITIFVPKDQAFNSLKNPSLSNISLSQLKSLILYHALPHYYSLADFKNLSQSNPVGTFAGGKFMLNFTDVFGSVHVSSGWTNTKITSSVRSTDPVAVYQVDQVLIPEAIFGNPPPPSPPPPAPAPAPALPSSSSSPPEADKGVGSAHAADSPSGSSGKGGSSASTHRHLRRRPRRSSTWVF